MAETRATVNKRVGRETSPDSTMLTIESNFSSLFSSTSASVDRCSFTSDALDHDSLSSEFSQHLGGRESLTGPDLDPPYSNKRSVRVNSLYSQTVDKAKARQVEDDKVLLHEDDDYDGEFQALDSARSSFSVALKECHERRSRSEALVKKLERQRTASFDLNHSSSSDVVSSSTKLALMKRSSVSSRKSTNFPSPGTPSYRQGSMGVNMGWSSERVPLPTNSNKRVGGAALLPLNNNTRALPSKWEDAERWIFSPVAGEGGVNPSSNSRHHPQRRPKSKSGPLGVPGMAYYSMYSPVIPMYDGSSSWTSHMAGSPFSAGVMMADSFSSRADARGAEDKGFTDKLEPIIARSASVHGCIDLVCQASQASSQEEQPGEVKDAATDVSRAVSRRDMATQMSPEGSCPSSPRRSSFSPSNPSNLPIVEVQSLGSSVSEVRDVQIDDRVTVTRWSKKYMVGIRGKGSEELEEWKSKTAESCSSAWEVADTLKSISKARRQEAKITAWENLQKAKAEAAIRKLEMKLEKKRSSSMEKIMKKLKSAQKKAQEMRSAVLANQAIQVSKTNNRAVSFHRTRQMGSLSGCFTCHAF